MDRSRNLRCTTTWKYQRHTCKSPNQFSIATIDTPKGRREILTLTESGFYHPIFKSRKAVAKQFKDRMFDEGLSIIRASASDRPESKAKPPIAIKIVRTVKTVFRNTVGPKRLSIVSVNSVAHLHPEYAPVMACAMKELFGEDPTGQGIIWGKTTETAGTEKG